ncbi:MAG: hypothetical protein AAFV46_10160 [Cyanobacteria bacterium J06635_11]
MAPGFGVGLLLTRCKNSIMTATSWQWHKPYQGVSPYQVWLDFSGVIELKDEFSVKLA